MRGKSCSGVNVEKSTYALSVARGNFLSSKFCDETSIFMHLSNT